MPAPPSYLDIDTDPYDRVVTQAEFNSGTFGGTANQVWLRYVVGSADVMLAVLVTQGGTFGPLVRITDSVGSTLQSTGPQRSQWLQLTASGTYYVQVVRSLGGASDFDFTVSVDIASIVTELPTGALIINDDSEFPATAWTTAGVFLGFLSDVPGGEIGAVLPNGISLWHDLYNLHSASRLALLDAHGQYVLSVDTSPSVGGSFPVITTDTTQFYVIKRGSFQVYTVSSEGTVSALIATLEIIDNEVSAAGVSADGSVLYWTQGYGFRVSPDAKAIHKHNLLTDAPLADLYEIPSFDGPVALTAINQNPGDLLVLTDDSLVTWYQDESAAESVLIHVSPFGDLLHSETFTTEQIDHIALTPSNPDSVYVWLFKSAPNTFNDTEGRFGEWTFDAGFTTLFDKELFSSRVGKVSGTGAGDLFGPSASCTMITSVTYDEGEPEPEPGPDTLGTRERRLIRRERVSPHLTNDGDWQFFHSLDLDIETGQSPR